MLNNKRFSSLQVQMFRDLPYEEKVRIFETNCKDCPHKRVLAITEFKTTLIEGLTTIEEVLTSTTSDVRIKRECHFNPDEPASLNEIVMNTCEFWYNPPAEEENEGFFEVEQFSLGVHIAL